MSNQIVEYYKNQAGSGLAGFEGYKHQRGHGFGSFFKSMWRNIVPYFAPKLISTGIKLGNDYLSGENMKSSLSKRLRETGGDILDDASSRAKKFVQTGKGRRRRPRRKQVNLANLLIGKKTKSKRRRTKKKQSVKRKSRRKTQHFKNLF